MYLDVVPLFMKELDIESKSVAWLKLNYLLLCCVVDDVFWLYWSN